MTDSKETPMIKNWYGAIWWVLALAQVGSLVFDVIARRPLGALAEDLAVCALVFWSVSTFARRPRND